jgi:hypothetical protein
MLRVTRLFIAPLLVAVVVDAQAASELPALTEEILGKTGTALHVDVQTGRVIGISDSGPKAEVGAKIVEVFSGDHAVGGWVAYLQSVDGDYVKPAVTQRLVLLDADNGSLLLDEPFSAGKRDELAKRLGDFRRARELLTADKHVPDYLMRAETNALLHVVVEKSVPYDRGRGFLSATHTAKVRDVVMGDFKPGQTVEYVEETDRKKRLEPPASADRIVLLTPSRSIQDGTTKLWLHQRVNFGYTDGGLKTLKADAARVRAAQAAKAAKE